MSMNFRTDTRGVGQAVAVGMILGTAFVLAIAVGAFMLSGGAP